MNVRKVGIVGCGLMGSGIALACAKAAIPTVVCEVNQELLEKGIKRLFSYIEKMIAKERATETDRETIKSHLSGTTDLTDFHDCDLIIEAIPEKIELKTELFTKLDKLVKSEAIFATNTSSLKVKDVARSTSRTDRFLGLHFFNPVPVMKLVEVVRTDEVDSEVFKSAMAFIERLGKVGVACLDTTGFVVNRLLVPYLLDAIRAYQAGIASVRDIDNAMRLGCGYPMGPLTLLDFVGLDTTYHVAEIMTCEFGKEMYHSPILLQKMVKKGLYGKKSGRGFYDYSSDEPVPNDKELQELVSAEDD